MKNWNLRFREVDRGSFEQVRSGAKAIETRAASVKYQPIVAGDTLTFVCGTEKFQKNILKVHHWPSIDAMVKEIPFRHIMPSIGSVEEMKKAYASYPGYEEKIKENGLLGFELADV